MANVRPTRARFVGMEPMVNAIHKWEESQMAAEGIKPEHIDDLMSAEALTVVDNRAGWDFRAALALELCNSGFRIPHNIMSDLMEATLGGGSGASCTLTSDNY